jgi:D-arabinose 1-dehydrogenase-like Zn-dependent alcohol dehydrogenase
MKALHFTQPGSPLALEHSPEPVLGVHDIRIRVRAAGICRSDLHYRSGFPLVESGRVLGHEVAGDVVEVGSACASRSIGDRVVVHYTVGCGTCERCMSSNERFCTNGQMVGKDRNGGYAEYAVLPERNTVLVPSEVSDPAAAVMGCSSSTSLHALRKGRLAPGETVAIMGAGGLGMSAIQLAFLLGASRVFAIDIDPSKLEIAAAFGADPVDATDDPLETIRRAGGADVALELVGSAALMRMCLDALNPLGRAVAVGLTPDILSVGPYTDLVAGERELIGCSDHTIDDLEQLMTYASNGDFSVENLIGATVALNAQEVNGVLDGLAAGTAPIRTVVIPD